MTPVIYLILLVGLLAVAMAITAVAYYLRSRRLLVQATKLGLQFSGPDRFLLSKRVAAKLPVPGAAEVKVRDVAYGRVEGGLLCVMTASFTIGSVGRRRHLRRVCVAVDPGGAELREFEMLTGMPSPALYAEGYERARALPKRAS